jgi:hypothetical protein
MLSHKLGFGEESWRSLIKISSMRDECGWVAIRLALTQHTSITKSSLLCTSFDGQIKSVQIKD